MALVVGLLWLVSAVASAAQLRGVVRLPRSFKALHPSQSHGFWTVPHPELRVTGPLVDPRRGIVLKLEGPDLFPATNSTPVVVLEDFRFSPPVLPIHPRTRVTFINNDNVLHLLEPREGQFLRPESLTPGDSFSHTFGKVGTYPLHCSEFPHMQATVLVTAGGLLALAEDNGTFSFENVPAGSHTLRVWYDDGWRHSQPVTVRGKMSIVVQLPTASKD